MNIPVEKYISVSPKKLACKFLKEIKKFYKEHTEYENLEEASETYISRYLSEFVETSIENAVKEQAPGCGVEDCWYIQLEEEIEEIVQYPIEIENK